MKILSWLFLITLLSFSCFVSVGSVQAMSLAPTVMEVVGSQNQVLEQELVVVNSSNQDQVYRLSTLKFEAANEGGSPRFVSEAGDDSGLPEWIVLPVERVEVSANEAISVSFKIVIPDYANAGGHYAAIVAELEQAEAGSETMVVPQLASLILLTVDGKITEKAALVDFVGPKWSNRLPIEFDYRVQNQGNVHLKPSGVITITNWAGAEAVRLEIDAEQARVLPMSTRLYQSSWQRVASVGTGFISEIENEWQNFGLGRYQAELKVQYGQGQEFLTKSLVFWIIPWHLISVALGLIVVMLLISKAKINLKKNV